VCHDASVAVVYGVSTRLHLLLAAAARRRCRRARRVPPRAEGTRRRRWTVEERRQRESEEGGRWGKQSNEGEESMAGECINPPIPPEHSLFLAKPNPPAPPPPSTPHLIDVGAGGPQQQAHRLRVPQRARRVQRRVAAVVRAVLVGPRRQQALSVCSHRKGTGAGDGTERCQLGWITTGHTGPSHGPRRTERRGRGTTHAHTHESTWHLHDGDVAHAHRPVEGRVAVGRDRLPLTHTGTRPPRR